MATPDSSSKADSELSKHSSKTALKDPNVNCYPGILKVILCSLRSGVDSLELMTFLLGFIKKKKKQSLGHFKIIPASISSLVCKH